MQDIMLFLQNHWQMSTLLVSVLVLLTLFEYFKAKRGTNRLTPAQLTQFINHQDAIVVDVRAQDAYLNGHIVGALSLPIQGLDENIKKIEKFKSKPIVLVCATGTESPRAAITLKQKDFQQIYFLNGGIRTWKEAGMPLVKG